MADPFSASGSAVGVVSLSIQICKGLVWYIDGVKDAKDKAEQISTEVDKLRDLLELLESIVSNVDKTPSAVAARYGVISCADAINTIKSKLGTAGPASSNKPQSGFKTLMRRLSFPFKEADIRYWKEVLHAIENSLQTALLALLIDEQRTSSESMQIVQSHVAQFAQGQNSQYQRNLQQNRRFFEGASLQLSEHT
ncbi:hypothetical protein BKA66DRAFT_437177 [Pyrenochaeta sp. MPI-SDFR-AT-0127]|nr:hypothetical protein BKA66DRAFT_437177 [Pyrenochaeta sp. MPI-SDFR-AT-0127]